MAFVRPSLVVDSTTTSGTGTYTLTDPAAPGGGFRTLADALADGDVTAGDTISYFVVDTTSEGATLNWEHGTGTVGAGGLTLARTTIIESSNGDAAVSWPSGGSRTVRFGAGTSGFALLAQANNFTALQTFGTGWTASANSQVVKAAPRLLAYVTGSTAKGGLHAPAASMSEHALNMVFASGANYDLDDTSLPGWMLRLDSRSGQDKLTVLRAPAGTNPRLPALLLTLDSAGNLTNASGTAYATGGVLSAPSGTRLLLGNNSVPTGWSIVASLADKTILTTSTASEIDDVSGSWTISGLTATVDNAALTTRADIPVTGMVTVVTQATHNHTASVASSGAWRPSYYKMGLIEKS